MTETNGHLTNFDLPRSRGEWQANRSKYSRIRIDSLDEGDEMRFALVKVSRLTADG